MTPKNDAASACAINRVPVAHQWRNPICATTAVRLREKVNGEGCAIEPFPVAHLWRNGMKAKVDTADA